MKKLWFLLLLLTSCGTSRFSYLPYVGEQQHWPTEPGAFVQTLDGVPIYHGLPSSTYAVIGKATADARFPRQLVWAAREHGADALIITDSKTLYAGSVGAPGMATTSFFGNTAITTSTPGSSVAHYRTVLTAFLIKMTNDVSTNEPPKTPSPKP